MIPNLSADELLFQRGDYLKSDQRDWLGAFILLWEYTDFEGLNLEPLVDLYDHWLNDQILQGQKSDAEFLESL